MFLLFSVTFVRFVVIAFAFCGGGFPLRFPRLAYCCQAALFASGFSPRIPGGSLLLQWQLILRFRSFSLLAQRRWSR